MRVHLIAFGKLKTPGMRDAADHYLKNIRPWVDVIETELKPLPVADKSDPTRRKVQAKEGTELLSRLAKHERLGSFPLYLLDETGEALSTSGWVEAGRKWEAESPEVVLAIGSSLGFSEAVRARARGALSLGPQTLPHELARVVILEQLYRAWSVIRKHPYHNDGA